MNKHVIWYYALTFITYYVWHTKELRLIKMNKNGDNYIMKDRIKEILKCKYNLYVISWD